MAYESRGTTRSYLIKKNGSGARPTSGVKTLIVRPRFGTAEAVPSHSRISADISAPLKPALPFRICEAAPSSEIRVNSCNYPRVL